MWRFAPDVDPTTPEIYTAMSRMIPTPWGTYRTGPSISGTFGSGGAVSGTPVGSALLAKTDGTTRWVVGTPTKLYDSDATGTTFTDRSGAATFSAADYVSNSSKRWQFAQFGDVTIAVQLGNNPQASSSGNFADLGGSPPKAACVAVQSNAVILANVNTGSAVGDGWYASDVGDHTNWSTGEAANGRLLQTPGDIKCLIAFKGVVLAFKETSVYEGQYVGGTVKWAWRLLHPTIGTSSASGVATNGQLLFVYGLSGAYIYDGAQFTRVDQGVEKYAQTNFAPDVTNDVIYSYKEQLFCIYALTRQFMAYCPATGLWSAGLDAPASASTTIVRLTPVKMLPGYARRVVYSTSVPNTEARELTGADYSNGGALLSSVTTGWIGNDLTVTNVTDVIPQFVPAGDYSYNNGHGSTYPAVLTHKTAMTRAATMASTSASPVTMNTTTGRFNVNVSARWHEFTITDGSQLTGNEGGMELSGITLDLQGAGKK
jgi:hypothetical protein